MKKFISVLLALICIISSVSVSFTAFASGESDYVAAFTIDASKKAGISAGEAITVTVNLKTNYPVYVVGLPVIYDASKFEILDTSTSNLSSFLTFKGIMATSYITNGNWKSPAELYTKRNSNPSFWSKSDIMSKYKIATATWTADSRKSNVPVTLTAGSDIVSFRLKAKSAINQITVNDIFISDDFKKTSEFAGGVWYVGRCSGDNIFDAKFVAVGQKLTSKSNFSSQTVDPGKDIKTSIEIQYKSSVDLMNYLDGFDRSKCSFVSSNPSVVSMSGSVATGSAKGSASVRVTQSGSANKAFIAVDVEYAWWQWLIVIFLFGWIWY